jgi:selenocysteine lyase/cysteine desulfurase
MSERIYLDWNATAPLRPEARAAMLAALDAAGNPSSVHHEGRAARHLVEQARERVAALIGAEPRNVVFTSGGTEANRMALSKTLETPDHKHGFDRLMISTVEHASVRAAGGFALGEVDEIAVTADGVVDLAALERRLADLQRDEGRRWCRSWRPTTRPASSSRSRQRPPSSMPRVACCMWTQCRPWGGFRSISAGRAPIS